MVTLIRQWIGKLKPNRRRRSLSRTERREAWLGLLFISPWIVGFLLFKLFPIAASFGLSLTNFNMIKPEETLFIGLENYGRIFGDLGAGYTLFSTISLALILVPLQLLGSLGLAALVNSQRLVGKSVYRTLVFLPSIIPGVAIALVWFGFLDPATGWLNRLILEPLGLPPYPGPYSESGYILYLAITALWSIGPGFLIILGAMKGVPRELYEAARVAGAGPLLRLLTVTLPIISPAVFFSIVINLIAVFGGVPLLDRGLSFSGSSLSPFDDYIYYTMFQQHQLGYAASLAWMMLLTMMVTSVSLFLSARYWVYYPEED